MRTNDIAPILALLFGELANGASPHAGFMLNGGDPGLLRSLDKLTPEAASRAVNGGATIAAHTAHVRYGVSLMNRWATEGGDPFATAEWGEAWKVSAVDARQWDEIRSGLRQETERWLLALATPREVLEVEATGMVASVAHLAYHIGAIRQIATDARGPKDGAS